jgi:hypothetical protein
MINNIKLTDIFGRDVINETAIILVHINNPDFSLELIYGDSKNGSFWKIKDSILNAIFNEHKNYITSGTIWFKSIHPEKTIYPLINISNSTHARKSNNYKKIYHNENFNIWLASDTQYTPIGLVISKNMPSEEIGLINNNLIKPYNGIRINGVNKNITTQNEFNLLGLNRGFTIDRIKYLGIIGNISGILKTTAGHFVNLKNNKLFVQRNNVSPLIIKFTTHGELMIDSKCIEESNHKIKITSPNGNNSQKWIPYFHYNQNGSYLISFMSCNSGNMLYYNQNKELVTILPTNNITVGKWIFSLNNDDTDVLDSESWITQIHNDIMLSVPKNPWFKNRIKPSTNTSNPYLKLNYSNVNKKSFTKSKLNTSDSINNNDYFWFWFKLILCFIIVIIIMSVIYHYYSLDKY